MGFRPICAGAALVLGSLLGVAAAYAAEDFPQDKGWIYGKVAEVYRDSCAGCHGRNFEGGKGPSLISPTLRHGSDDDSMASSIRTGSPEAGMPAFRGTLSAADIRALVIYLRERRMDYRVFRNTHEQPASPQNSELHRFRIETVAGPDGR